MFQSFCSGCLCIFWARAGIFHGSEALAVGIVGGILVGMALLDWISRV